MERGRVGSGVRRMAEAGRNEFVPWRAMAVVDRGGGIEPA